MLSANQFLLEDDCSNHTNDITMTSEDEITDMYHVLDSLLNNVCIPDVVVWFAEYVCLGMVVCILENIAHYRIRINIVSNYL
jgi:hypothetical protein